MLANVGTSDLAAKKYSITLKTEVNKPQILANG